MNYNSSVYIVFILLMVYIIIFVGRYFYTNGRIFIITLLKGQVQLADYINKALLAAYYLFNIGYALLRIKQWPLIQTPGQWISSLAQHLGTLILILALTHYFNMLVLYYLSKSNSITHKSFQS